jgi:hydroxypyruvate isomerase
MKNNSSRRSALKAIAHKAPLLAAAVSLSYRLQAADEAMGPALKGRINHSVCKWCYGKIPLEEFCQEAKKIGLTSVELMGPDEWPVLKKHGLTCAMANGAGMGIEKGWNNPALHDQLVQSYEEVIPKVAAAGLTNVICFSGNRNGMPDEQGLENCAKGLKRLMPAAEKNKVTVVMELLNSKVDHKDYMCDHTAWGAELAKRVGSDRFKLLYDIYHMQIMEGDVIATIKKFHPYIAHYHTGGVPGRNEIDETQELYYPAIMRAIVDTGYTGFVGQEFIPKREPLVSLKQGVQICDV